MKTIEETIIGRSTNYSLLLSIKRDDINNPFCVNKPAKNLNDSNTGDYIQFYILYLLTTTSQFTTSHKAFRWVARRFW